MPIRAAGWFSASAKVETSGVSDSVQLYKATEAMLHSGKIDVWYVDDLDGRYDANETARYLSCDERRRAESFAFEEHRRRYVSMRIALRKLLAQYTACRPEEIKISCSRYGKPRIENRIEFNVSYSQGMGVVALAMADKIGVDLEKRRFVAEATAIVQTQFSESEIQAYSDVCEDRQSQTFFELWTRKEAFVKAVGRGLSFPLREFSVCLDGEMCVVTQDEADSDIFWMIKDISPNPEYAAALACGCRSADISCYWY